MADDAEQGPVICRFGFLEALVMVLGVLLLRDSRFDHFGDSAGGKQEGED